MTASHLLAQLQRSGAGMAATTPYSTLPVLADVTASSNALGQQLTQLANLERGLKEFRLELDAWLPTYGGVLQRAALACENADSTPATMVSGGRDLRRAPGPPQIIPAPTQLGILQGLIAGEGTAR